MYICLYGVEKRTLHDYLAVSIGFCCHAEHMACIYRAQLAVEKQPKRL